MAPEKMPIPEVNEKYLSTKMKKRRVIFMSQAPITTSEKPWETTLPGL